MQLNNFKISDDHIGLDLPDGTYLDLHNDYVLIKFEYRFEQRYFELEWRKSKGDWVKEGDPKKLSLNFFKVQILRTKEIDQDLTSLVQFPEDDTCLSMIGFTDKEDTEFLGYRIDLKAEEKSALAIQTENGQALIIYSEIVKLETS